VNTSFYWLRFQWNHTFLAVSPAPPCVAILPAEWGISWYLQHNFIENLIRSYRGIWFFNYHNFHIISIHQTDHSVKVRLIETRQSTFLLRVNIFFVNYLINIPPTMKTHQLQAVRKLYSAEAVSVWWCST